MLHALGCTLSPNAVLIPRSWELGAEPGWRSKQPERINAVVVSNCYLLAGAHLDRRLPALSNGRL